MEREERTSRNIPKKEYSFDGIILLGHEDSVNGRRRKFFSVKVAGDFLKVAVCLGLFFVS
jgi:hypothetical protein